MKVVRDNLKIARNRQKSYVDNRRRDLQFEIGDHVFLKISPWKGVLRFGRRGKLRPRYIGSYEIISRVGQIAYRLDLPPVLSKVHNVFHVSMLRKYIPDPSHVLRDKPIKLKDNLTYKEQPMQIIDLRVILKHIFVCIEEISVLYSEIQISLLLRRRLKLKSRFVFSLLIS